MAKNAEDSYGNWQLSMRNDKLAENAGILRHPMMLLIIGFLLTGGLGTIFSQWLNHQQIRAQELASLKEKELEKVRADENSRKLAVQNLSKYIYERRVRAEMVASSIRRDAPFDELKDRKRLYDQTFVKWNSDHQANLFLVRDVLGESNYSLFESIIERTLVKEILKPLDACLTQAYDASLHGKNANDVLNSCDVDSLITQTLNCGYAITDELYKISTNVTSQSIAKVEISRRCPAEVGSGVVEPGSEASEVDEMNSEAETGEPDLLAHQLDHGWRQGNRKDGREGSPRPARPVSRSGEENGL